MKNSITKSTMRRLIYFVAIVLLALAIVFGGSRVTAHAAAEDSVDIPDENLKALIIDTLELSTNVVTENDMKKLTVLETPENDPAKKIVDLSGLEYAVNLVSLNLDYNKITDLTPIAGLTKLEELDISYNNGAVEGKDGVTDISCLAGLTSLKRFASVGNAAVSDYSAVANFRGLTYLNLSICGLDDVSFVGGLTGLEKLYLAFNSVSDIYPLENLRALKTLALGTNKVVDISVVSGMSELTQLTLEGNYIDDFSPVLGLAKLNYLDVSRNFLSNEQTAQIMETINADTLYVSPVADESKRAEVFTLDESTRTMNVGENFTLAPKSQAGSAVSGATYNSTDTAVATVSADGKVTAAGKGTCHIVIKANGFARGVALTVTEGSGAGDDDNKSDNGNTEKPDNNKTVIIVVSCVAAAVVIAAAVTLTVVFLRKKQGKKENDKDEQNKDEHDKE